MPKRQSPELQTELAAKRAAFNPVKYWDEKYPWYIIEVGQEFTVSKAMHSMASVRGMAQTKTKISGYVFSVKSRLGFTRVTRIA